MSGITFDFWYGDKLEDCDKIKVYFSDLDCKYRGNLYKNGEAVGDFVTESSIAIEKAWNATHDDDNKLVFF